MSRIGQDSYSKGGNEEELSEQDRKTYAIALEIFSSRIVSSIVSRELQDRLYAIEYVKEFMENENYMDETDQACDKVYENTSNTKVQFSQLGYECFIDADSFLCSLVL